ncbi:MAG: hypothetical protein ACLQDY_09470 [Streptosporangiaceae bacterium]
MTLDRFCEEEAAKDESLRRKLEADYRPLRSSALTLTDDELMIVADLARGDAGAIEDALEAAWELQRSAG